jgi:chromate transporter
MQRQVVQVHHWMTAAEFAALFAVAQAAPGPNMLVVTLVGWRVAGLAGATVATLSLIGPASILTYFIARVWHRPASAAWRGTIQAGLTPVTVGLVLAAAALLSRSTIHSVGGVFLTLGCAAVLLRTRLHPLWLLAGGAALGVAGLV